MNKIIQLLGHFLFFCDSICSRFINRYKLSKLGAHGVNCHIEGKVSISTNNVYIGNNVFIPTGATFISSNAKILIGNNVMFGPNVMIATGNHRIDVVGQYMIDVKTKRKQDDEDVIIEDDVWIGMNAMILKGVRIGEGSVIGAGAIITKDIPPYSIVTNTVNTRIKYRFSPEEITNHKEILRKNG